MDDLINLFFEGVLGDETVDEDVVLLSDAVGAVCRLRLYGGIPPEVVVDDMGGGGEIETGAGGFQGEDEESRLRSVWKRSTMSFLSGGSSRRGGTSDVLPVCSRGNQRACRPCS